MRYSRQFVVRAIESCILFSALGSGCTSGPDALGPGTIPQAALRPAAGTGAWLAKGLAEAMGDADVATAVRDILRDSPYALHRVHLQEALRGARGRIVLDGVAHALSTTGQEVLRRLDASPRLSLVVPSATRRVSWVGTPNVIVAAQFRDEPAPGFAYGSNGNVVTLAEVRKNRADTSAPPFLAVRPFEVLAERHVLLPTLGRRTISVRGEPQGAVASVTLNSKGERTFEEQLRPTTQGWRVTKRKSLRGHAATLDVTDSPDTLWVGRFKTYQMGDLDEGEQSILEFEFQYEYKSRATGAQVVAKYTNYTGRYTQDTLPYLPVLLRKPDAFGKVYGALIEDDGFWGTDHPISGISLVDETYNRASDPSDLTHGPSYVQLNHIWHPSSYSIGTGSSSVGEYATISGSSSAHANAWCSYFGSSSLSGATIEWFVNGTFYGTGSWLNFSAPSQDFSIVIGAYDANGRWAWDEKSVTIDEYSTCEPERRVKRGLPSITGGNPPVGVRR